MTPFYSESGLSTGTVYKYFRGKDDILHAAVLSSMEGLLQVLRPVLDRTPTPAPERLVAELLLSVALGYVAQKALTGQGNAESHARGLSALLGTGRTAPG